MDRLEWMRIAVAVADAQGFNKAARKLGLSAPAVTRAVAALEQHLGVALFVRTTRHVRLTEAGARYVEDARRLLTEIAEVDEAVAGINAAPRGSLLVTAPVLFGRLFVMPGVVDFLNAHPQVNVSALFVDRVVNLVDEGIDVGIRIGDLPDSQLHAVRVGQVRRVLCASPDYLRRCGTPDSVADLAKHSVISASGITSTSEWHFGSGRKRQSVRLQPRLTVNTNDAAIAAAVAGLGITRLLSYQVAHHAATGELAILLDDEAAPLPVHVIYREGRRASAKIRGFVDAMAIHLRGSLS